MSKRRILHATCVLAGAALSPAPAHAGSQFQTDAPSELTASAHLDFTIVVPRFVFLQVGTGTPASSNTAVDNLVFAVPADHIGDGTAVPSSSGQISARVIGNNGAITFSSATQGPLSDGTGETISYSEMSVAVAPDNSAIALAHPALVDGSATSINLPTTSGDVTNLDAKWTFSYRNTNVVPAGTYGGVNSGNGRVTYSVSMP